MKKIFRVILFSLAMAIFSFFVKGEVIEEIIVVVNDDIITRSELEMTETKLRLMLSSRLKGEELEKELAKIRENLLDQMINELLLLQEAKAKNIEADEEVKIFIENFKKENNITSDEDLKREMEREGINYDAWRRELNKQFIQQKLLYLEVDSKISITDSEIINYYKDHREEFTQPAEVRLRGIYLSSEGRNEQELEKILQEINQKIKQETDFSLLASQYSEGPEKEKGGDLGFFKKGELDKAFEKVVFELNPGEVTPWLKTKNGRYLFKIEEKKEERVIPFEEAKKKIKEETFNQKRQEKLNDFLKTLKEKSYIKILNPTPFG
ncbi:MAG: peptidylprolyl isomerase [Candidatus Aminicenantia bacterium]